MGDRGPVPGAEATEGGPIPDPSEHGLREPERPIEEGVP